MSHSVAHRQPSSSQAHCGRRAFLGTLPSPVSSSNEDRPPDQQSSSFNKQPTSKRMIMARNLTLLRLGASTIIISRMNNLPAIHELTPADFSGTSMPLCLMQSSVLTRYDYQVHQLHLKDEQLLCCRSRGHQMGHPGEDSVNPSTTVLFAQDYGDSPLERARSNKNYTIMIKVSGALPLCLTPSVVAYGLTSLSVTEIE
ncbi:hypothetical protein OPV22_013520 [Ensete ventricosum]|uniref:Uncharacterized protein n=1 Tax=Ensete ventricosum TaxID=4639 RepID=A0AAV8PIB9_ENSVE|nr:hypothetical protein OPV22_013520 [Ensete ventricosum]